MSSAAKEARRKYDQERQQNYREELFEFSVEQYNEKVLDPNQIRKKEQYENESKFKRSRRLLKNLESKNQAWQTMSETSKEEARKIHAENQRHHIRKLKTQELTQQKEKAVKEKQLKEKRMQELWHENLKIKILIEDGGEEVLEMAKKYFTNDDKKEISIDDNVLNENSTKMIKDWVLSADKMIRNEKYCFDKLKTDCFEIIVNPILELSKIDHEKKTVFKSYMRNYIDVWNLCKIDKEST